MTTTLEKPPEKAATKVTALVERLREKREAKLRHYVVVYRNGAQRAAKGLDTPDDSLDQVVDAIQTMGRQAKDFESDIALLQKEAVLKHELVDHEKKNAELHTLRETNANSIRKLEAQIAELRQGIKNAEATIEMLSATKVELQQMHAAHPLLFGPVEAAVKAIEAELSPRMPSTLA